MQAEAERLLAGIGKPGEKAGAKQHGGFDEIAVSSGCGEDLPSWAEDLCAESLPYINKEV
jgi:hypothetical protein